MTSRVPEARALLAKAKRGLWDVPAPNLLADLCSEIEELRAALQMIYDGYSAGESRAFMSVAAYEALEPSNG